MWSAPGSFVRGGAAFSTSSSAARRKPFWPPPAGADNTTGPHGSCSVRALSYGVQTKHNPPAVHRGWGVTSDSGSLPCFNLMLSTDLRFSECWDCFELPRVTVTWKLFFVLSHPLTILRRGGFGTFSSRTCEPVWNLRFRLEFVFLSRFSLRCYRCPFALLGEQIFCGFLGWISSRSCDLYENLQAPGHL